MQHDFDITNADANTGLTFRAAVNAALQALASNNSGVGDPAITYPYQFKVDTGSTPKVFYMRKGDNTAWTRLGYIDSNGRLILDRAVTSVTGNYTALVSDDIILASGTLTINLSLISSLSGAAFSKEFTIINDGTGTVTVDGNGTEKIGEQLAVALKPGESLVIAANGGSAWKRLNDISFALRTEDVFPDFVISGLLGTDPGASLTMTTPQGTAYIGGRRIVKQTGDSDLTYTYTASQDTYDYLRIDGAIVHQAVANGAAEPSQPANTIKLQKVVTNGTEITGVTDMRPLVGMAASQTKAANKIPIADANGLLSGWFSPSSVRDISRDLIVKNNVVNPTFQVDIDASEIMMQDSSGNNYRASSVDLTADITVNGINGCVRAVKTGTASCSGTTVTGSGTLFTTEFVVGDVIWFNTNGVGSRITAIASDTSLTVQASLTASSQSISNGGEAPNTWYYIWAIFNGTTVAAMLSTSLTAPTMPSGYNYKALVSAIYNDSSYDLVRINQSGGTIQYTNIGTWQRIAQNTVDVGNVNTPTWVAVAARGAALPCPPTAKKIRGCCHQVVTSSTPIVMVAPNNIYGSAGSTITPPPVVLQGDTTAASTHAVPFEFVLESDNIYWAMQGGATASIFVTGWEF